MELTTFLLIFIVGFLFYVSSKRPKNFPEGIRRIPIIGQGFRGTKPPLHLWRTHKLMGHFIGNRPAVTIQNFSMAKDLFSKDEWCGRGLSIISRYFRSDSGINKVTSFFTHLSKCFYLSVTGHHQLRRAVLAGAQTIRSQTFKRFWFWESWTGRSHSGGS